MIKRRFASILCCALLSSCATQYPVTANSTDASVQFVLNKKDLLEIYAGSPGCSTPARMPDQHDPSKADALPLPIAAGKEFMFKITGREEVHIGTGMTSNKSRKSCTSTVAFMPQAGARYRASQYRDDYRCRAVVVRLEKNGTREVEVPERTLRAIYDDRPGMEAASVRPTNAYEGGGSSARSVSCPAVK